MKKINSLNINNIEISLITCYVLLKSKIIRHILTKNKQNLSKLWKVINRVIGKNKISMLNNRFKYKGDVLINRKEIADNFNDFFVNVGPNLAKLIPHSNKNSLVFLKQHFIHSFYFHPVVEDDIRVIISSLRDSSPGWDEITPKVVKYISNSILEPLTYILNLSLQTGIFPDVLKLAKVIPLHKKEIQNYLRITALFLSNLFSLQYLKK